VSQEAYSYVEIADDIGKSIRSGKYASGSACPSLTQIMRRYDVTRVTASRAVGELKKRGFVSCERGRGTFVTREANRAIGLIIPGVAYSEFFPPIVSEISRLAQANDYTLLFGDVAAKTPEKRAVMARKLAREFVAQQVSGVLYQPIEMLEDTETANREILSCFDRAKVPVVIIDNDFSAYSRRKDYDVVGIDNVAAGALVAEHLLGKGVRRISFQKRPKCSASVHARQRGVVSALTLAGVRTHCAELVAEPGDAAAVRRHLRQCRPEAFVCGNDAAAVALMQTLAALRCRVPDDVLVAGFDDVKLAKVVTPQLTTVRQPCEAIAGAAFRRLLDRIRDPAQSPVKFSLPIELVVRASTVRAERGKARTAAR